MLGRGAAGGELDQQQRELMLLCLPNAIPDEIALDVSGLELGGSLHASLVAVRSRPPLCGAGG